MWRMKGIFKISLLAALLVLFMPGFMEGFQAERDIDFDPSDEKIQEEIAKKQYAFIIGINQYKKYKNLENAVKDAREVKKVLLEKYYFREDHIKTLFTNDKKDEATYENIIKELKEYINILTADDSLFVLFSGHGFNDMVFDTVYWVPSDAEENSAKGEMKIGENIILGFLRKCPARHILIVSASCYSGKLFYGRLRGGRDLYKNKKSRQILAAGKGTVSDGKRYEQNSPFVKNFLKYLKKNTKPYVLASDMIDDLLRNKEKKYDWPIGQEPIGGAVEGTGDERGSFVFVYKHSAIECELRRERDALIESFNYGKWSRDMQIQKGEAFLKKCISVKDSNTAREFENEIGKHLDRIKMEKSEIKAIQDKYLTLVGNLNDGDVRIAIEKCQEFLYQSQHYSEENELKKKFLEIRTIKEALESYNDLMKKKRKVGLRKMKKACHKFLNVYKDKQNIQQVKTLVSHVNSLFNTLKTPRLYFGSSYKFEQGYSQYLNLEMGYVFGERLLLIPFVSYDINLSDSLFFDEYMLSNDEKVILEEKEKGSLKGGIRLGIRPINGKKINVNINLFFNYGQYSFSLRRVSTLEGLDYHFKRISSKRSIDLFSVGLEAILHLSYGLAFNLGFIETFTGKGTVDYEIYSATGSTHTISYSLISHYSSMFVGIKIYFLKR